MENIEHIFSYNNPGVYVSLNNMVWYISSKKIECNIFDDIFKIKCILKKYTNSNRSHQKLDNDRFIREYQDMRYLYFGFGNKEKDFDICISSYIPKTKDIILQVYNSDDFQFELRLEIDKDSSEQLKTFSFKIKKEN